MPRISTGKGKVFREPNEKANFKNLLVAQQVVFLKVCGNDCPMSGFFCLSAFFYELYNRSSPRELIVKMNRAIR